MTSQYQIELQARKRHSRNDVTAYQAKHKAIPQHQGRKPSNLVSNLLKANHAQN